MSKSILHVDTIKGIQNEFQKRLPINCTIYQESPLRLADSEPEPDITVVKGSWLENRGQRPTTALLVVEVAVSNVELGREYASIYAEANVSEYWIVLAEAKQIEVRRRPVNGSYVSNRLSAPAASSPARACLN